MSRSRHTFAAPHPPQPAPTTATRRVRSPGAAAARGASAAAQRAALRRMRRTPRLASGACRTRGTCRAESFIASEQAALEIATPAPREDF